MAGTGKAHLYGRDDNRVLLRVEDLTVEFPVRGGQTVHAVSGISFDVLYGETLGVVGESGCGKSSAARAIMQLPAPTSGSVVLESEDLTALGEEELRRRRQKLQMIFQDPISSLNPRRSVKDTVAEGLRIWRRPRAEVEAKVRETLDAVGLDPDDVGRRRPAEFSGGQCQRICIARAIALEPKMLICDEPVSSLDVSVQAQILNLLDAMRKRYGLTLVFIAHDLAVVKHISDRVIVMYMGKMCEVASPDELFSRPGHHYTRLLLASIPEIKAGKRTRGSGRGATELPSPLNPPTGCRFRTRCLAAQARCAEEEPAVREFRPGHFVACHFPAAGDSPTHRQETESILKKTA